MRMFLVEMCDVFLILYLTTLVQVPGSRTSGVTVEDYYALQDTEQRLRKESEQSAAEVKRSQADVKKLAADLRRRELALESAKLEGKKTEEEYSRAEQQSMLQLKEKQELILSLTAARQALETRVAQLSGDVTQAAERVKQFEAAALQEREMRAQLRKEADDALRQAEEASARAREAQRQAEEALLAKHVAEQEKFEAVQRAGYAESKKQKALALAKQAAEVAEISSLAAARAAWRADSAVGDSRSAFNQLKAVTQPVQSAYDKNIAGRIVTVQVVFEEEQLFGPRSTELFLRGVAVEWQGESVVFFPVAHMGFDKDMRNVRRAEAGVAGKSIQAMLVNPRTPGLAALILPENMVSAPAAVKRAALPELHMPTLIAVRNGSRFNKEDRMLGVSRDYFYFPRERLVSAGDGVLEYRVEGERGTKDYAEKLILGDQIVDLDGNFIGIAAQDDRVILIDDPSNWRTVALAGRDPREIAKELFETE